MGLDDKASNKAQELGGKAKEALGRSSDDPELTREGQRDQASAGLKQAGEKVKDAFEDVKDAFKKHD
ncbi:CsbD family protein [Sinomonas humi]|uniref:CsbD-like domain-containing protein n=1 Tax=Sinomonas humi TaxID=1338436 RepID=A0A0B2AKC4_9MICC|nr:CsbD family protein [Sinomonas humi]KHL04055.1 hypothetical protein LK10_07410 [Sinomonas humi]